MNASTPNKFAVFLTDEQRQRLTEVVSCGKASARKIRNAHILLWSDRYRPQGRLPDRQIATLLKISVKTVERTRKRFVCQGEMPAIERKVRDEPPTPPKLDGRGQAQLIAICCGPPPDGRTRWTLTLMADALVERGVVTSICAETVRQTLKKTNCNPGASRRGASPNVTAHASSPRWRTSSTSTPQTTTMTIP